MLNIEKYLEHAAGLARVADQARSNLYAFSTMLEECLKGRNLAWTGTTCRQSHLLRTFALAR